jgi:hypothetical protein
MTAIEATLSAIDDIAPGKLTGFDAGAPHADPPARMLQFVVDRLHALCNMIIIEPRLPSGNLDGDAVRAKLEASERSVKVPDAAPPDKIILPLLRRAIALVVTLSQTNGDELTAGHYKAVANRLDATREHLGELTAKDAVRILGTARKMVPGDCKALSFLETYMTMAVGALECAGTTD